MTTIIKRGIVLIALFFVTLAIVAQNYEQFDTICFGETYTWNNRDYIESGDDTLTLQDVNGQDSVVILHLFVHPEQPITNVYDTICFGGTYTWNDSVYADSGEYEVMLQDMHGCDSLAILHLFVHPEQPITNVYDTICFGGTYTWNDSVYADSGDYALTLQDMHGCDSLAILHLFIRPEQLITNVYDTICFGETYTWNDSVYADSGEYEVMLQDANGCDSVVILSLIVLPIAYTTIDTTIIQGETYMWNEIGYQISGVYVDTLQSIDGCDSIVTLNLNVLENNVVVDTILLVEQCADDNVVDLVIEWEGHVDSLGLYFVRDSLNTLPIGLHDTIVPMPMDGQVSIVYEDVRAGIYETKIVGYFCRNKVFESTTSMTFLYPSSVLEQRWDDVICVLTSGYNGGYDFVAFQWYKDGQPIEGENNYYLTQPLEDGAEYSVLLTESDSTQLMSCPLMIGIKEDSEVTVEPTLITNKQLVRCVVPDAATIYVYDMTGRIVRNDMLLQGETYIQMPYLPGIYMVKVLLKTGDMSDFKIVVL